MVKYRVLLSKQAVDDLAKLQAAGLGAKAKRLYEILREDPFTKNPRYEALVGNLKGYYSRRINLRHRLIYRVDRKAREVYVVRMWTHYGD